MLNFLRFILGGNWWTLWYGLMHLLIILPQAAYCREFYAWTYRKTGEPAGSMALSMVGIGLQGTPMLVFTLINGGLFLFLARGSMLTRSLILISSIVVLSTVYILLHFAIAGSRSYGCLIASYVVSTIIIAFNLWMLWTVRQRGVPSPPEAIAAAGDGTRGVGWNIVFGIIPALIVLAVIGVIGLLVLDKVLDIRSAASGKGGHDCADQLIRRYATDHWHNTSRTLDANNTWTGLYGCAARYDPAKDALIADFGIDDYVKPEEFDLVADGIEDPELGGRYDRRGATIVIDRLDKTIRLVKEFPVAGIRETEFSRQMDDLWQAAQFWRDGYLARIPAIKRGEMPAPTESLTIEQEWEKIRARR